MQNLPNSIYQFINFFIKCPSLHNTGFQFVRYSTIQNELLFEISITLNSDGLRDFNLLIYAGLALC